MTRHSPFDELLKGNDMDVLLALLFGDANVQMISEPHEEQFNRLVTLKFEPLVSEFRLSDTNNTRLSMSYAATCLRLQSCFAFL